MSNQRPTAKATLITPPAPEPRVKLELDLSINEAIALAELAGTACGGKEFNEMLGTIYDTVDQQVSPLPVDRTVVVVEDCPTRMIVTKIRPSADWDKPVGPPVNKPTTFTPPPPSPIPVTNKVKVGDRVTIEYNHRTYGPGVVVAIIPADGSRCTAQVLVYHDQPILRFIPQALSGQSAKYCVWGIDFVSKEGAK